MSYEDQSTKKEFDLATSISLPDKDLMNPSVEFDDLEMLSFLATNRQEKISLLHQMMEVVWQCQFKDYPFTKNLSMYLLNLVPQYIYSRDHEKALNFIHRTVEVRENEG